MQTNYIKLDGISLPPLYQFRDHEYPMRLNPQNVNSSIKYLKRMKFDFDVYLTTKNMNLQRELVWNLQQKQELIMSIIIGRHIPQMAFIFTIDDTYLVIDGKQRISTIFDFVDDKFAITIWGNDYLFSKLPSDFQNCIMNFYPSYLVINEEVDYKVNDEDKINWFNLINFAGTPQDREHMIKLKKQ